MENKSENTEKSLKKEDALVSDSLDIEYGKLCNACLSSNGNLIDIFSMNDSNDFISMYKTCTSINLTEATNVPPRICDDCLKITEQFYEFREMCLKSQEICQKLVITSSTSNVKSTIDVEPCNDLINGLDNKEFVTEDVLNLSKKSRRLINDNILMKYENNECFVCNQILFSKDLRVEHILEKHQIIKNNRAVFGCNRCDKTFKTLKHLEGHINIHNGLRPYKCKQCSKSFPSQSLVNSHMVTHKIKYLCSHCGKTCNTKMALRRHSQGHLQKRLFPCDLCSTSCCTLTDLAIHTRTHTDERPFLCPTCGKSFRRSSHLTVHKRIHTGEKPFNCEYCHRKFAQKGDLNSHKRVHTGSKPFGCIECGQSFRQSSALNSHLRQHELIEGTYKCEYCEKVFARTESLHRHSLNCKSTI